LNRDIYFIISYSIHNYNKKRIGENKKMSYEIINENLGVYSCNVSDLTLEQTKHFLELWNDGSTIGSVTVFFDNTGRIVLNKDHKKFEAYREITVDYLILPTDQRELLRDSMKAKKAKSIIEVLNVLDSALIYRHKITEDKAKVESFEPIKKILGHSYVPCDKELDMIDMIYTNSYDRYMARLDLYNYAFIQGKRAERARRKKGLKKVEEMKPKELYNELEGMKVNEPERFNFLKSATTLNSEQLKKLLSAVENIQQVGVEA
jgi:hypothetical protein